VSPWVKGTNSTSVDPPKLFNLQKLYRPKRIEVCKIHERINIQFWEQEIINKKQEIINELLS
jgi:hypothetical protein